MSSYNYLFQVVLTASEMRFWSRAGCAEIKPCPDSACLAVSSGIINKNNRQGFLRSSVDKQIALFDNSSKCNQPCFFNMGPRNMQLHDRQAGVVLEPPGFEPLQHKLHDLKSHTAGALAPPGLTAGTPSFLYQPQFIQGTGCYPTPSLWGCSRSPSRRWVSGAW